MLVFSEEETSWATLFAFSNIIGPALNRHTQLQSRLRQIHTRIEVRPINLWNRKHTLRTREDSWDTMEKDRWTDRYWVTDHHVHQCDSEENLQPARTIWQKSWTQIQRSVTHMLTCLHVHLFLYNLFCYYLHICPKVCGRPSPCTFVYFWFSFFWFRPRC